MLKKDEVVGRAYSWARTFFPNRLYTAILREKAGRELMQRWSKEAAQKSPSFWLEELPHLLYKHRRSMVVSFVVFVLAFGVGIFSSMNDPDFGTAILGRDYVEMTLQNIALGDPLAVYKQKDRFEMAAGITANNLLVSLLSFALGILAGLGTIGLLISNGVMVGVFQSLFIAEGLFYESFLTIWTHGLPEMAAMIIAGGAGITMGSGWLFPGQLSRLASFRLSAREGLKILAGIIPVLVFAGFAEGYLTRYTDAPDGVRWAFILICLFFILFYFVWYPSFRFTYFRWETTDFKPVLERPRKKYERMAIHSNEDLIRQSFQGISGKLLPVIGIAFIYTAIYFFLGGKPVFPDRIFGAVSRMDQFYTNFLQVPFLALVIAIFGNRGKLTIKQWIGLLIIWGLVVGFIQTGHPGVPFLLVLILPVAFIWTSRMMKSGAFSLIAVFTFLRGQLVRVIGLQLSLLFIGLMFLALFDAWLVKFALNQILANVLPVAVTRAEPVLMFIFAVILFWVVGWMSVVFHLMDDVLSEIREAPGLRSRVARLWLYFPFIILGTGSFDKTIWQQQRSELRYFHELPEPPQEVFLFYLVGAGLLIGLWWLLAEIRKKEKHAMVAAQEQSVDPILADITFVGDEVVWEKRIRKSYADFLKWMQENGGWEVHLRMSNRQIFEYIQDERLAEIHRWYEAGFYGKKATEEVWLQFEQALKNFRNEAT
jgi:uncharacterized membrane protein SpoIIM required for sporulation